MSSAIIDADPCVADPERVVASLATDAEVGLSAAEAARRLAADGRNEITPAPPVPTWRKIVEQFRDPLIYLLFATIATSLGRG